MLPHLFVTWESETYILHQVILAKYVHGHKLWDFRIELQDTWFEDFTLLALVYFGVMSSLAFSVCWQFWYHMRCSEE